MKKILILGGYGNFGVMISRSLARAGYNIIIAGRSLEKAQKLAAELTSAEAARVDLNSGFDVNLKELKPHVVINTCGPFQNADYTAAAACINNSVHYIDLADARDFVCNITSLDNAAKANNVTVISGASTVPGLSSAVLEEFKDEFNAIDSLKYGISPGQKTTRGLATVKAVMSYVGRPIRQHASSDEKIYGWQNTYLQKLPEIGHRLMANCEVPDIDLLPPRYNIKHLRFSAGMESKLLHAAIWICSWIIRLGLPVKLENHAEFLLKASYWFNPVGSADGGMHMIIKGQGKDGKPHERQWFIIATSGDGPNIPCVPAIVLAKKLVEGKIDYTGAQTCVGLLTLKEYMEELKHLDIRQYTYAT